MRSIALFYLLVFLGLDLHAQKGTYTITADTVLLASCDSTELTLRNHSDTVPGFLFNNGYGHTIFKRGLQRLSSGSYIIGADTLKGWLQGGNKFGTTGVLGTVDNNPLDLYSNGSQQIRLAPNGRTLFGSTSDNGYQKFQFTGPIFDTVGYFTNFSSAFNTSPNNSGAIRLRWGGGDGVYIGFYNQGNLDRRGYIGTPSDARALILNDHLAVTVIAPFMSIGQEGNLGSTFCVMDNMGTAAAQPYDMTLTHITPAGVFVNDFSVTATGHTMLNNQRNFQGNIIDNGKVLQVYGSSYFSDSVQFAGLTQDSTQTRVLVSDVNGNLHYRSASSLALDNPIRSSLAVNGTIKSKNVIISPDEWADYVFDSAYRLPHLDEVETYIHREHHLPGIPSAAAVQKDSLDVGAGEAALLKKIEELTLYTIDQNKKLDQQQKEIEQLKAKLEMLIDKQGLNKHE